jgi:hypothetical protein
MISKIEFDNLWEREFASLPIFYSSTDYSRYVKREVLLQDYLDLFKGSITYRRVSSNYDDKVEYFAFEEEGKMNYCHVGQHAYENHIGKKRKIKHVFISGFDSLLSQLLSVDLNFENNADYFTELLSALYISNKTPVETMVSLADKGVLPAFDLFPFEPSWDHKIEDNLRLLVSKIEFLWQANNNPISITNRIQELISNGLMAENVTIGFLAGVYYSEFISHKLNIGALKCPGVGICAIKADYNEFLPKSERPRKTDDGYMIWYPDEILNGKYHNPTLFSLKIPRLRSICYGYNKRPDEILIRNSIL